MKGNKIIRKLTLITLASAAIILGSCGSSNHEAQLHVAQENSNGDIFPTPEAPEPTGEIVKRFSGKDALEQVEKFIKAGPGPGSMAKVWLNQLKTMKAINLQSGKSKFQVYKLKKEAYHGYETYIIRFVVDISCAVETYEMTSTLQEWGFTGSLLKLISSQTYCTTGNK
ncbi:hypothetical protein N9D31_04245 [Oligoflexaceae bacterium]|nr:hypothetical protein [Oligoflexaceae bacterium]